MAHENSKGWIGSLAVHGALGAALLLFSGLGLSDNTPDDTGSLVIVFDGDGSPSPSSGGGNSPVPLGNPDAGSSSPLPDQPLFNANKINRDLERRLEEQRRAQEQAAREAEQEVKATPAPTPDNRNNTAENPVSPKPTVDMNAAGTKKPLTLQEFQQQQSRNNQGRRPGGSQTTNGRTNTGGNTGNTPPIQGSGINVGNVVGNGPGPIGLPNGVGLGPNNPGGGGPVAAGYRTRALLLIQAQWQELLATEGGGLDSTTRGEFHLVISNGGNLSFGGWVRNPNNPLFERLLRRAIDNVGNVGSRPAGMPSTFTATIAAESR